MTSTDKRPPAGRPRGRHEKPSAGRLKAGKSGTSARLLTLLKSALPHLCLVLCLMMAVFFSIDRVNSHIGFMKNEFHKWLALLLCVTAIVESCMLMSRERRRVKLESRRKSRASQGQEPSRGRKRPVNILLVLLTDVLITGAALCVFALFDHVLPQSYGTTADSAEAISPYAVDLQKRRQTTGSPSATFTVNPSGTPGAEQTDALQSPAPDETPEATAPETVSPTGTAFGKNANESSIGLFDFPGVFTDGEIEITDESYRSENLYIELTTRSYTSDYKDYRQTYHVMHVYVRDIGSLKSVFAKDTYGKGINEAFMSMVERSGAISAINTDFYNFGRHPKSMLIRNGLLYGHEVSDEYDLCVINFDGTMDVYKKGKSPDGYALLKSGAMHTFCFGPMLLRGGSELSEYEDVGRDPRTCIGMVEPGHYVFLVCEGRSDSAKGFTYEELASLMLEEGCSVAYNLDGGDSSQMAFLGKLVNDPSGEGRSLSDIFYIAEP